MQHEIKVWMCGNQLIKVVLDHLAMTSTNWGSTKVAFVVQMQGPCNGSVAFKCKKVGTRTSIDPSIIVSKKRFGKPVIWRDRKRRDGSKQNQYEEEKQKGHCTLQNHASYCCCRNRYCFMTVTILFFRFEFVSLNFCFFFYRFVLWIQINKRWEFGC